MKGHNIKKCQQRELSWICKTDQKARNHIMLFRTTKCPMEDEKIEYAKKSSLLISENKMKPNTMEYLFMYYNS